jgi:hypothetical protein
MANVLILTLPYIGFITFGICLWLACRACTRRERGRYDERLRQGGWGYDIELGVVPRPEATLAPARDRRRKSNSLLFTNFWQIAPSLGTPTTELDSTKLISTRRNGIETRNRILLQDTRAGYMELIRPPTWNARPDRAAYIFRLLVQQPLF